MSVGLGLSTEEFDWRVGLATDVQWQSRLSIAVAYDSYLSHTPIAHSSTIRAWSLWEYEIPPEKLKGRKVLEVAVKATDTSYNVQPERIEPYWNLVRV